MLKNMTPVKLDGLLYVLIAVCGFAEATLTSDDIYKYMNPYFVFYVKWGIGMIGAGATALKMFRSTTYSDHVIAKKAANDLQTGNTTLITKADVLKQSPAQPDPSWSTQPNNK